MPSSSRDNTIVRAIKWVWQLAERRAPRLGTRWATRGIGFRDGREIAEAWPGARLLATDGLGPRRLLRERSSTS